MYILWRQDEQTHQPWWRICNCECVQRHRGAPRVFSMKFVIPERQVFEIKSGPEMIGINKLHALRRPRNAGIILQCEFCRRRELRTGHFNERWSKIAAAQRR